MFLKLLKFIGLIIVVVISLIVFFYIFNTVVLENNDPKSVALSSTKFIDIGGEEIAYSEVNNNSSTTVVFVGGLSSWHGVWEDVVTKINSKKDNLNYIVIDLPPFGYSIPEVNKNYFRDTQAKRIEAFIEAKDISNVILVGHSYGAGPIMEYAFNNQGLVEKLILIDAVLNIDENKVVTNEGLVQIDYLRNILIGVLVHNDTFALSRLKTFVYITDNVNQDLLNTYNRYFNTDGVGNRLSTWLRDYVNDPLNYQSNYSQNYRHLSFPVRLIWGDKDTLTPISDTEILLTNIPDCKLKTLPDVGHIPMIENIDLFNTALLEAIDN